MIWINRLFHILPKKQIDLLELERENAEINTELKKLQNREQRSWEEDSLPRIEQPEVDEDGKINGEYEILEREILPEKIVCSDCGGITLEGLEFCDRCGADMTSNY